MNQLGQSALMASGQIPGQLMAGYPNQMLRVPNGVMHQDDIALQQRNLARQAMVNNQRKQPFPQNQ